MFIPIWLLIVFVILGELLIARAYQNGKAAGRLENPENEARRLREEERAYLDYGITPPSWRRDIERYQAAHPEMKQRAETKKEPANPEV